MTEHNNAYNCRNCGAYIGEINMSRELVMETAVLEQGTFHCSNCGMTKAWNKYGLKLNRIIDRIIRRRLTNYVTVVYNTHDKLSGEKARIALARHRS